MSMGEVYCIYHLCSL